jgi:hypothetical protein
MEMAEFYVMQQRDMRIGDTWNDTGLFGVGVSSVLAFPAPCPICGMPAQICTGNEGAHDATDQAPDPAQQEPAAAA